MSFNSSSVTLFDPIPNISESSHPSKSRAQVRQVSSVMLAPVLIRLPCVFTQASPISTSKSLPVLCPKCEKPYGRLQELKRHIMSLHLPCWIYCPRSGCSWRGHRKDKLRIHLREQKCGSVPVAEQCQASEPIYLDRTSKGVRRQFRRQSRDQKHGSKPRDEQYQIYEANMITEWILKDKIPVAVAASYALVFAGEMAQKLRKEEVWADLWGQKGRKGDMATQPPGLVRRQA
jgi:hypothetical protein